MKIQKKVTPRPLHFGTGTSTVKKWPLNLKLFPSIVHQYYYPTKKSSRELKKKMVIEEAKQKGVGRIAKFINGKLSKADPVWQGVFVDPIKSQGYMYGQVQHNGQIGESYENFVRKRALVNYQSQSEVIKVMKKNVKF